MASPTRTQKRRPELHPKAPAKEKTVPGTKADLEKIFPLGPIKNERDYNKARALADKLAVLVDPTADQEEWFDKITDFMEAYEDVHYPM